MSKLLDPDNGFFTLINKIIDTLWLGILWCVIGLGVFIAAFFTENQVLMVIGLVISAVLIGPASAALYYATVKVTRRNRSYVTKEFFHSFKDNFKVGAITSFIYGVFAYLMYVDFQYANTLADEGNSFGNVMFVVFVAGSVFAVISLAWIFPVLSRFTVGVSGLFRNAMLLATKHLIRSLLLILIWLVVGVACYCFYTYLLYIIILVPLIPGVVALLRSFIIEPVLRKLVGESAGDPEETGIDEWYRE